MSSKSFGLFALGIFALVLVMGLGSAAALELNLVSAPSTVVAGNSVTVVFNVSAPGATVNYTSLDWSGSSSNIGTWTTLPSRTSINIGETHEVSATLTVPINATGTINAIIDLQSETTAQAQLNIPSITVTAAPALTESAVCAYTGGAAMISQAELNVDVRDITVTSGFGKDEEWLLFDEVEVEIKVENNGDFDLEDITIEWAIAKDALTASDFAVDWDEVDEITLKDGDEDTLIVSFQVSDEDLDNMDLDELSGLDSNLVVRAIGTIDDPQNGPDNNKKTCDADFQDVSIQDESDFVILTNIDVPETVSCGDAVQVTADVWNIGDSQQDEVSVDVYDTDRELIDALFEVGDIDEFDNTDLSFTLEVPRGATEKTYSLVFNVLNEDNDVFENDYDEDAAEFVVPLTVSGGCAPEVSVSASTVSGGQAGKDLVVKMTVANTGDSPATYTLSVSGAGSWTSSAALDQQSLVLGAGESRDVTATFAVNKEAAGSQTFTLDLISEGRVTAQPVTVSIEPSRGFLTGFSIGGDNWYLWGIGLLNLLLVVVIIVVAVRIARRR